MVDIEIVSGAFKGTPQALQNTIRKAYIRSVIQGVRQSLKEFLPTVAKDTGALSHVVETMILNQILGIAEKRKINICLNKADLSSVPYAKYHVLPPGGESPRTTYIKPTTPGTKPISNPELMGLVRRYVRQQIILEVRQKEGLDLELYSVS